MQDKDYYIRFLVQNVFLMAIFWRFGFIQEVLLLGELFYKQGMSLIKVLFVKWGMKDLLKYGSIIGYKILQTVRLFLHGITLMSFM